MTHSPTSSTEIRSLGVSVGGVELGSKNSKWRLLRSAVGSERTGIKGRRRRMEIKDAGQMIRNEVRL